MEKKSALILVQPANLWVNAEINLMKLLFRLINPDEIKPNYSSKLYPELSGPSFEEIHNP